MIIYKEDDLFKQHEEFEKILKRDRYLSSPVVFNNWICHGKIISLHERLIKQDIEYDFWFYRNEAILGFVYFFKEKASGEILELGFPYDCYELGKVKEFIRKYTKVDIDEEEITCLDEYILTIEPFTKSSLGTLFPPVSDRIYYYKDKKLYVKNRELHKRRK